MRQKDSAYFALLLNRPREGKHTKEDINPLTTRLINTDIIHPEYPFKLPHIYLPNKLVDSHNNLVYESSASNSRVAVQALDVVLGDVPKVVKDQVKHSIPKSPQKTIGQHSLQISNMTPK